MLGAVGGLVGRAIIRDAENAAQNLIDQFNVNANALSARLATQLTVATGTAVALAGAELDKKVRDMNPVIQQVMVNLKQLTETIGGLRSDAFALKDAVAVDIRSLTANVPFVGERFFVQRVDGILQLRKDTPYKLKVLAVGLGPATDRRRTTLRITIDGHVVDNALVDQIQANTATITIPADVLNPLFGDRARRKAATLEIDMQRKSALRGWRSQPHISIPFALTLMPIDAGSLDVITRVPTYGWDNTDAVDQKFLTTAELSDTGRYQYNTLELKLVGTGHVPPELNDQKYRRDTIEFACISGQDQSCGHRDIFYVQPVDNDRTIQAYWRTSSHPTTWRLSAKIAQWKRDEDRDLPARTVRLEFGRTLEIPVPENYTQVHLVGKTITGEPIDVYFPNSSDLLQPLSTGAGARTLLYFVKRPSDVD